MTRLLAGIDVGNATTEVVIADTSVWPPRPVGWDRAPTRGRKGSTLAYAAAFDLLARLERQTELIASDVVLTQIGRAHV